MTSLIDFLVIGAGPAGLAFASILKRAMGDKTRLLVVDMGKHADARQHDSAEDIAIGAGGAGLFSDGKFSYFPAGTVVWKLTHPLIELAHKDIENALSFAGPVCAVPTAEEIRDYFFSLLHHEWKRKDYPTTYLSLTDRKQLIDRLVSAVGRDNMLMGHRVEHVVCNDPCSVGRYTVKLVECATGNRKNLVVKRVVCAGGRFFPVELPISCKRVMRRYEFGIRLEASADNPVMVGYTDFADVVDPKFIYKHKDGIEFRTFCWCRRGETVVSNYGELTSVSGRSDCEPTARSNFGLLVRVTDPELCHNIEFISTLLMAPFTESLQNVIDHPKLLARYGKFCGNLLHEALVAITLKFPELLSDKTARIHGPAIEGVGSYPRLDHRLATSDRNIHVIGDATGVFRGIIPCMLSGYWLAHWLAAERSPRITFVTGNENKRREVEQILGPVRALDVNLREYQGTPEFIVREKCVEAKRRAKGPVLVEDTSLVFEALGTMPGPYIKHFYEAVGCDGLVRLLADFPNKRAAVRCLFAYCGDDDVVHVFEGQTRGCVVKSRGSKNFGWDSIFQPDGHTLTYAEMDDGAKNKVSHRFKALVALRDYLERSSQ